MNTAARRITGAKPLSLQAVAQRLLEEADGDMNSAAIKLANYASNINSYRDELLLIGARKLLNEVPQVQRAAVMREYTSTSYAKPAFARAPHRMSEGAKLAQERMRNSSGLMKSILFELKYTIGGITRPLREWTGTEIAAHAEIELTKGQTAVRNARFLIAVGRSAGAEKVGHAIDAASLERMKAEADASEV